MRIKNKYLRIDRNDPQARAVCDYSGIVCMHEDLIKQMEYRGNGLSWTGFMVHKKFADVPNPQNLTPLVYRDPIPIRNPRPQSPSYSGY